MSHNTTNSASSSLEITCQCSAELEVMYCTQAGHNEKEIFKCPECKKEHSVKASLPIMDYQVKLVKSGNTKKTNLAAPDFSAKDLKRILQQKGYTTLFHSNTVQTSAIFIDKESLLSREYCDLNKLKQTSQQTDKTDKEYGIHDYIYFDLVDIHSKLNNRNYYGPILFKFSDDILDSEEILSIRIIKKNPTKWHLFEKVEERYYMSLEEFESNYRLGDFDTMIVFNTKNGILPFGNSLYEILVDNPNSVWTDVSEHVSEKAKKDLVINSKNKAKTQSLIKVRACTKMSCGCYNQYNVMLKSTKEKFFRLK